MTSPGLVAPVGISEQLEVNETTSLLSLDDTAQNENGEGMTYAHSEVDLEAQFNLDGAGPSHEHIMIDRAYQEQEDLRQEQEILRQRQEELEARQHRFETG